MIFDFKTHKETRRVTVGMFPDAGVFEPSIRRVFTLNDGSNDVTAISAESGMVVGE